MISPIGFFFGLTVGAVLGGGWSASLIEFLMGQKAGKTEAVVAMFGTVIGFFLIFVFFLLIGANTGNLLGYGITKLLRK
ncbi:MAG: hypothetical protein ACXADB_13180 [Candidatus Hermodarchaeia archaeon]